MIDREGFLLRHAEVIAEKGWNEDAFQDPSFPLLFPDGLMQAAEIYFRWSLKETFKEIEKKETQDLKTFAKIRLALMTRFEVLGPFKGVERQLFHYLLKQPRGLYLLYTLMNELWYWAGDKSLDHNFYTKRLLLAGVYSSTFLAWMQDDSESLTKTQEKLDQRLAQVGQIPKFKDKIKSLLRFRT